VRDPAGVLPRWRADLAATPNGAPTSGAGVGRLLLADETVSARTVTVAQRIAPSVVSCSDSCRAASDDALRLAVRLLAARQRHERLLLFGAVGLGRSAKPLVYETVLAFLQLQEHPLLILDLEGGAAADDAAQDPFAAWPTRRLHGLQAIGPTFADAGPVCVVRAAASGQVDLALLASVEFAHLLEGLRERFRAVLCHASPIPEAVGGLIVARHCDGVVLSVPQGRTTLSNVRAATEQLRRVNACVLGFVMEGLAEPRHWLFRRKGTR
jgi:hypothetical protein